MTIDEAIAHEKKLAKKNYIQGMLCHANPDDEKLDGYIESGKYHEQLAEWLEKLQYIENIILKWNADWYNDEETGIPDNEILEAIFNACMGNGFDIPIDEDFREGYNKAIDDFVKALEDHQQKNWIDNIECGITFADIEQVAEKLKEKKNDGE